MDWYLTGSDGLGGDLKTNSVFLRFFCVAVKSGSLLDTIRKRNGNRMLKKRVRWVIVREKIPLLFFIFLYFLWIQTVVAI
jgi:hypothetical protein